MIFHSQINYQHKSPVMPMKNSLYSSIIKDIKSWNDAFIYTSSFSYLAAIISSFYGFPIMDPNIIPTFTQIIGYYLMFILLQFSGTSRKLRLCIAAVYGMAAMFSYCGLLPWMNYYSNSILSGPFMAVWDLTLGMALLKKQ